MPAECDPLFLPAHASWEIYGDWKDDPALLETTIKYLLA
jgi:hypothetical protein